MLLSRGSESEVTSAMVVAALRIEKEVARDDWKELLEEKNIDLRGEERRADESLEDWRRAVAMEALELDGGRMVLTDVAWEGLS